MEPEITTALAQVGTALTTYAAKGTVSAIRTKVQQIKIERNIDKLNTQYDEIITELLEEREDIIRIAQIYRNELEKVQISDDDIESLHRTIEKALDILSILADSKDSEGSGSTIESLKPLKDLISVDVLKTMQLLGFNYKDAIGLPLTKLCANAIENLGNKGNIKNGKKSR